MSFRDDIWTYGIVTAVTLLIWFLAANATREEVSLAARVEFKVGGEGDWRVVYPPTRASLRLEGSALAIREAEHFQYESLVVELTPQVGQRRIDLAQSIRDHPDLEKAGVAVISVDPPAVDVDVDEIRAYPADVVEVLPNIQPEDVAIEPATVNVRVPSRQRELRLPEKLVVEAFVDQAIISRLMPGRTHTEVATLRLPADYAIDPALVTIDPPKAVVTFTVRSRTRDITLETVRVHLAGPHEDLMEYEIDLEPSVLRNVTVSADGDMIRSIEAEERTVVAVLHLSNSEKERGIESKPIAYFLALSGDWTDATPVKCRVDGSDTPPVIGLRIRRVRN